MGGRKSTRWGDYGRKTRVEECFSISAKLPGRGVQLPYGEPGMWLWDRSDFVVLYELTIPGKYPVLKLRYFGDGRLVEQVVDLASSRPNFGGVRWWFVCPQCRQRVGTLHLPPAECHFGCRKCYDLSYESSQSSRSSAYRFFSASAAVMNCSRRTAREAVRRKYGGRVYEAKQLGLI